MEEPSSRLGGRSSFLDIKTRKVMFHHTARSGEGRSFRFEIGIQKSEGCGEDTIYDQRNTTLYFSLALLYNDKTQHYGWNRPHTYINDHQPTDAPFTTSSKASLRPNLSSSIGRTSSLSSNSCSNSITASSVSSFGSS